MKKVLAMFSFFAAILVMYGADAYTFGWGANAAYLMNRETSTNIGVQQDSNLTFTFNSNATGASSISFGVFTFSADGNVLNETGYKNFGTDIASFTQTFSAGDLVGMWVDVDGQKIYSVHSMNPNGVTKDGWKFVDGNLVLGFETNAPYYGKFENLDFFVTVSGSAPTGQPLPGILASLCVGGLAAWILRMKLKKN